MRLLHICIFYRNPMFSWLINCQINQGIDLRVLYYQTRKMNYKKVESEYVDSLPSDVWYLPTPMLRMKRLDIVYRKAKRLYGDFSTFDLMHAHTLCQDGYLAWKVHNEFGLPYIVTIRNCDFTKGNHWEIKHRREIYKAILKKAEHITFLSNTAHETLYKLLDDDALSSEINNKSSVIPNGIDEFWHSNVYDKDRMIPKEQITFLTVGRIETNYLLQMP